MSVGRSDFLRKARNLYIQRSNRSTCLFREALALVIPPLIINVLFSCGTVLLISKLTFIQITSYVRPSVCPSVHPSVKTDCH